MDVLRLWAAPPGSVASPDIKFVEVGEGETKVKPRHQRKLVLICFFSFILN